MEIAMQKAQLRELVLQALTHEKGGVLVYQTALECVVNADLREEWEKYLGETEQHLAALVEVCTTLNLDQAR
jgi:hypothetical protein